VIYINVLHVIGGGVTAGGLRSLSLALAPVVREAKVWQHLLAVDMSCLFIFLNNWACQKALIKTHTCPILSGSLIFYPN
jgi:hypothetical protein